MPPDYRISPFGKRHILARTAAATGLFGLLALAACSDEPTTGGPPCTSTLVTDRLTTSTLERIDILLSIDNSRSMADKQAILALAIPDLVQGLLNPPCLDDNGATAQNQPASPLDECPQGTRRKFPPLLDAHIGVISSSIGGHGADSCPDVDASSKECAPAPNATNNDKAHLLSRLDPCGGATVDTYPYGAGGGDKGFLAWDPTQLLSPPGEPQIGNLQNNLHDMVEGVGQIGCGYESQLESVYRFLADPHPYESISIVDNRATPSSADDAVLLQQRAEFLRPDSLLAIVMLTDENDCSIKEYGQFYYVGQLRVGATTVRLPRARQECATNPDDPCCLSCGQNPGSCPADPTCVSPNGGPALLTPEEDDINLRCWDQKRRFGIDFLYPTDRYVQAFSSAEISDRAGNLVPNPIFSDLNPGDAITTIRDPSLVFFAGIVGVPWQDIARDKSDLTKGFKNASELRADVDGSGYSTWDMILGSSKTDGIPLDPLMRESIQKRTGTNPITGDVLVDASMPNANPINGHEWTIPNDDLQYACIFPLPAGEARDCTDQNLTACDCFEANNDNPLCQADPNNNNAPTLQVRAKAYPSRRILSVLRDLGDQAVVGSVCPARIVDPSQVDFGYRPAIGAILDRLTPTVDGGCMPRSLNADADGRLACLFVEARATNGGCACDPSTGRVPVPSNHASIVNVIQQDPAAGKAGWDCFCELEQASGDELFACQNDPSDRPQVNGVDVNRWCYVDASSFPPLGNPEILASCPDNEKRNIRFLGSGAPKNNSTVFMSCIDQPECAAP